MDRAFVAVLIFCLVYEGRDCDEDIEDLTVPDAIMTTPGDPVTKRMSSVEMNQTDDTVTKRMSSTEVTQPDYMVTQRLSSTEMTQPDDTVTIRMSSKEMTEPGDMVTKRSSSTAMTKPEGKTTILPNVTKAGNETEQLEDGVTPYEYHDFFPDGPHVLSCSETKCPEGSTCVSDGFFTYCECPAGKVGVNCNMEDPCLETNENCTLGMICFGPCNPNVFCEGATGIPHCTSCIEGYTGDGCKGDVDECTEYFEDVCNNNGNCTNTNGGFYCTCFEGFVGRECDEYIEDFTEPVAKMTTSDDTVTKRMSSTEMTHPDYTVTKRMSSKEMTQLDDTVTKRTSSKEMTQPDYTVTYQMSSTSLTQPDGKKTTLSNGRDCEEDIEDLTVPDAIMTTPGDPVTKRMSSAEMNQTNDTVTKRMSSTEVTQPDDMVTQRLSSTEMTQPDDTVTIRMSSKEMTEPDDMVTKRSSSTAMTKPEGKTTILPNVTKAGNETEQLEDGVTPYEYHDFFPDGPHVLSCSETKCPEGSTCVSDGFFTYCECPAGKVGVNCDMEDPCLETNENCTLGMICFGPCNPNVFCEGATGIPHCTSCIEGYTGDGCKGDVDECTEYFEDVCNNNGNCTNTNGGFYCTCFEGFVGRECDEYIENFTEPVAIMTTSDDTVTKRMSSTEMTHPDYTVTKRMSSKEMTQLDDTVTKRTSSKEMTQPDYTVTYQMSSTSLTQPDGKKTTLSNGRDCEEDIEDLTVPDAIMTTPGDPVTKRMSSAEMNQTDDTVTKRMSSTEVTQPDDMVTQRLSSTEMTQPDDTVTIRMSSKEMTEPDDMVTKRSSSTAMTKPEGKTTILPNVTKAGNETEQLEDGVTPYEYHDFFPDGPHVLSCSETKCPEGSTCVSDGFFTYCECPAGKVGVNCDMEDPCLETNENCTLGMICFGPCNPNVFCEGATGIPHCTSCIEGYTGDGCKGDVDECTEYFEDVCNNNGNCTNTNGGFYCTCFEGFVGRECDEYIEDFTEPVAIMTTSDDTVTKRMSSTEMTHPDYTVTKRMSSKEMTQLDDTVTKRTSSKEMTQPDYTVTYQMSSTSLTQPDGKKTTLSNGRDCEEDIEDLTVPDAIMTTPGDPVTKRMSSAEMNQTDDTVTKRMSSTEVTQPDDMVTQRLSSTEMTQPDDTVTIRMSSKEMTEPDDMVTKRSSSTAMTRPEGKTTILPNVTKAGNETEQLEDGVTPYEYHDFFPDGPHVLSCSETKCPEKSTCVSDGFYTYCECPAGKVGVNCDMEDPCLETNENCAPGMICFGPCNPNVFCEGATGIPHCTSCIEGYTGDGCNRDVDECTEYFEDVCNNNGNCTNTNGGFYCTCFEGFVGRECDEYKTEPVAIMTTPDDTVTKRMSSTEMTHPDYTVTKRMSSTKMTQLDDTVTKRMSSTKMTQLDYKVTNRMPSKEMTQLDDKVLKRTSSKEMTRPDDTVTYRMPSTSLTKPDGKKNTLPNGDTGMPSENLAPSMSYAEHPFVDFMMLTFALIVTMATPFHF